MTFMRKIRIALVLVLVVLAVCGVPAARANVVPAASATFSANLTVSLTFPVIRLLGIASLNDAFLPNAVCLTQGVAAITACNNPTSTFMNSVLTFTAGTVAGNAGPGMGFATGVSYGLSETIQLTNLTGALLTVPISGTYNFLLMTTAMGQSSAGAAVAFQVDERTALDGIPTTVFGPREFAIVSPPNTTSTCGVCNFSFNIDIPNNSSVFINIDPYASGDAKAVPEPSAFIPLVTLATAACLRKKWLGRSS
jgi:hypothetical protein